MKRHLMFAAILAIAAPFASVAAPAEPAPAATAATAAPAEAFEVGPMLVERHGGTGSPIIFIPGLSSGPYVWESAVREFGKDHALYLVTLPGFNGRAASSGDLVAGAEQWIGQLIGSRKLVRPILVGHSLGATMSIAFAEKYSDQIGGVVAIDGLPVFPGTENVPIEQHGPMAAGIKQSMAGMTRSLFEGRQKSYMRGPGGVIDPTAGDALAARSAKSDPGAVADYMAQVLALDLRPGLPHIKVPVLLISPFYDADMKAAGMQMTGAMKADYYKSLMSGTPKLNVVSVSPSRHFAMQDQPQQVNDAIRAYLKSL